MLEWKRYNRPVVWNVEVTNEFTEWYDGLNEADDDAVSAAIEYLVERGPGLGRPLVDTIAASQIAHLKELRPKRSDIRILFVFDPRRTAILLIGGSKTNDWQGWYDRNISVAERLYAAYLAELREDGTL
ncbi:MAG: type II toxin-antitoxin system RelE/ParE family toxin [Thermomicrobiales bacterium]